MKKLFAFLFVLFATVGLSAEPKHPIFTRFGEMPKVYIQTNDGKYHFSGTVCPVGAWEGLTAAHVSAEERALFIKNSETDSVVELKTIIQGEKTDLSIVRIPQEAGYHFPKWFKIAKDLPSPGDRLGTVVYVMSDTAAHQLPVEGTYLGPATDMREWSVNGEKVYIVNITGGPGSSGACVINEAGDLIGITSGSYATSRTMNFLALVVPVSPQYQKEVK